MNADQFIDFMAKEARKVIEKTDLPILYAEKIEAWKEVEGWIAAFKRQSDGATHA